MGRFRCRTETVTRDVRRHFLFVVTQTEDFRVADQVKRVFMERAVTHETTAILQDRRRPKQKARPLREGVFVLQLVKNTNRQFFRLIGRILKFKKPSAEKR